MSDEKENETGVNDRVAGTEETAEAASKETSAEGTASEPRAETETAAAKDASSEADRTRPENVLKRLQALEEDSPEERKAAEEERRLAERKAANSPKKASKKGAGLEVSASKKLAKIGKRAEPRRTLAVAADADPLIQRSLKAGEWAQKNQKFLLGLGGALVVGMVGIAGFVYYSHKREVDASSLLTKAVADDRAYVGEIPKDADPDLVAAAGPTFKTYPERTDAALAKYREVESSFPKSGAAMLAKLSEGSLLLDKHDADGAIAAYNEAKATPLAAADKEVKGRALEGLGFAYELKAIANPADATKFYDEALKAYKELENVVDVDGFKELATYHQARVAEAKGDKAKAKELLVPLVTKLDKPASLFAASPFLYLKEVATARLRAIDPNAVPKKESSPMGSQYTPEQIRKMIQEAQERSGGGEEHP